MATSLIRWSVPCAWVVAMGSLASAFGLALAHSDVVGWIVVWAIPAVGCVSVGAVLGLKVPANPIGWVFLTVGLGLAVGIACDAYANVGHPSAARSAAVAIAYLFESAPVVVLPTVLLLFPSGRLPSRRWRPVGVVWGVITTILLVNALLAPGVLVLDSNLSDQNPAGLSGLAGAIVAHSILVVPMFAVIMAAAAVSLVMRYRRATGDLRQQVKWFGAGGLLIAISAVLIPTFGSMGAPWSTVVLDSCWAVAITALALTTGVAVVRYRLYEIDVIIRKTLVYATLIGLLAMAYLGGIYLIGRALQAVTGQSGALAVTVSTLAVAAAFQPLRTRIQRGVDHRFYRRRYDAAETLEQFTGRLRNQIELDGITSGVLDVVNLTLQPTHASLWLRPATSPAGSAADRARTA
jgi:hypothetical protein